MRASDSHNRHGEEWARQARDPNRRDVFDSWLRTDTVDWWRHARMYEPARAFLDHPQSSWLTVGDGRYGLDAIRLQALGFVNVFPSDIDGALLEEAKQRGLIENYAVENAESLSFADESFDLVFCKESYHHFPRPALAFYEMLRVAKKAVVLVEPRDFVIDHGPTRSTGPRDIVKSVGTWVRDRRGRPHPPLPSTALHVVGEEAKYEESGNYLYTISSREIEKVALGIDLPAIAIKGLNDVYLEGGEFETADERSALFQRMKDDVARADRTTKGGRSASSMLMAVIFKEAPTREARSFFTSNDWLLKDLPRNPYL